MNRNTKHKRVSTKTNVVYAPRPPSTNTKPVPMSIPVPVAKAKPVAPVAPFIPSAPEPEVIYSYDPPVRSKGMQLSEPIDISLPRMITPIAAPRLDTPHRPYFVAATPAPVPVAKPIPIVKAAPVPVEPPAGTRAWKIHKFIKDNFKS